MKFQRWALQDEKGRYLWSITSRRGVHFENDTMPQFSDLCSRTKLFDSEASAETFAKNCDLQAWGTFKAVPIKVTYSPSK